MEDEALRAIARKANERKTGARGLKSIMEDVLHDLMYEIPSMNDLVKVTITEDVVNQKAEPIFEYGEAREEKKRDNIGAAPTRKGQNA